MKYISQARICGLLLVLLILTSCASPITRISSITADEIWQIRRERLQQLEQWQLKGRIGFVSERESGSASLYWKQDGDAYELKIVAPLGVGSLVVAGDDSGVVLQSSDGEMMRDEDAQWLVWRRTGWVIPVESLRYWILGLPLGDEAYDLDDSGRVSQIQNKPWQVEYQRYQQIKELELPSKIQIQSPDIRMKLVVKDWQLN
jgi:outer membrane lipoprotein LolB